MSKILVLTIRIISVENLFFKTDSNSLDAKLTVKKSNVIP